MESASVRKSYLSISSPGVYLTHPSHGEETAVQAAALARRTNEYGADLKKKYPSRFGYFASLPLPDIERSLEEIDYCTSELEVDGFVILTNACGMYLGDERMAPIYDKLNQRHAVLFVHPTAPCVAQNAFNGYGSSPTTSTSTSTPTSLKPPAILAANTPLIDCYAGPMIEFMLDTTRNFSDLLLSGTASRYSNLRWIIPHSGAAIPSILDRIIRFSQLLPSKAGSKRTVTPLSESDVRKLLNTQFYFDLAGMPMNSQIHHVLRWVGHERLLYGSDVPFTPWEMGKDLAEEVREGLVGLFGVETGTNEVQRVCCGNAESLLGK